MEGERDPDAGTEATRLLARIGSGDLEAAEELLPLVYGHLRALAGSFFAAQHPGHTLQPTALVHEVYSRLLGGTETAWESRSHFMGVAARAMRQVLTDHARRQRAAKRGGDRHRITLADQEVQSDTTDVDLLDLDQALESLATLNPRQGRIIELRFFAGLSVAEAAGILEVSTRTIELDWRMARAWLRKELER